MSELIQRLFGLLRDPALIAERLVERRMTADALRFYHQRSREENDMERAAFFSQLSDISTFVEEARQLPTIQQIQTASSSSAPTLKIAASQTSSPDDCITMYAAVR